MSPIFIDLIDAHDPSFEHSMFIINTTIKMVFDD